MENTVLSFQTRELAESFATAWTRYSKRGHIIASGMEDVAVTVYDISKEDQQWINQYLSSDSLEEDLNWIDEYISSKYK